MVVTRFTGFDQEALNPLFDQWAKLSYSIIVTSSDAEHRLSEVTEVLGPNNDLIRFYSEGQLREIRSVGAREKYYSCVRQRVLGRPSEFNECVAVSIALLPENFRLEETAQKAIEHASMFLRAGDFVRAKDKIREAETIQPGAVLIFFRDVSSKAGMALEKFNIGGLSAKAQKALQDAKKFAVGPIRYEHGNVAEIMLKARVSAEEAVDCLQEWRETGKVSRRCRTRLEGGG